MKVDFPVEAPVDDTIEISIQKNRAHISIRWPGSQAKACGQWMADLLE